ncbi:MAG: diguanylate cyclase [Pirellulales bacterium]|nr:diguanylate cyclase [Pirellulales bacterium]
MTDISTNDLQPSLPPTGVPAATSPPTDSRQEVTQNRVAEISSLLNSLEEAATESGLVKPHPDAPAPLAQQQETRLVQTRLKMASSLFTALKHKHAPTATHSLRVALGCSSWALFAQLDKETRETVELAALMHDIGKIGVPDAVLQKASRLTSEDKTIINRHREMALDILAGCCGSERVLNAIRYTGARFDGQNGTVKGDQIPLEARMISIVDAFDSMTTDHVYRPAKSRERALNELFEFSGTQFDPKLVKQFVQTISERHESLTTQVASHWLGHLQKQEGDLPWAPPSHDGKTSRTLQESAQAPGSGSLFEKKLIEAMHDGVVFVDAQAKITLWSKGTEQLTGVSGGAALGRVFTPSLLDMLDHLSRRVDDKTCPVAKSLLTNTQLRQRTLVMGRQGKHVTVDLHAIPVHSTDGTVQGATVLLQDAQPEASLEEKCSALHAEVTKDPMTKVANRAEFDRMLALFVEAHQQAGQPCSLIMVDIDHFKSINDTFGHQAGDQAIITMAKLLSSMCRSGDLVARYGGEEFAVLCADCSNADGARRAEQIRRKLAEVPHPSLGNRRITASFGVTELQAGDSPETMLRRSDRALLMAKEQGRNQVIQLGTGMDIEKPKKKWWKFSSLRDQPIVESTLTSAVPIDIAIEKLRGFVSDHQAKILSTKESSVELEVSTEKIAYDRRKGDQHLTFRVKMQFSEKRVDRSNNLGFATGEYVHTQIELKIQPRRVKKSRKSDVAERARLIRQSIKSYLMAKDADEPQAEFTLSAEGT